MSFGDLIYIKVLIRTFKFDFKAFYSVTEGLKRIISITNFGEGAKVIKFHYQFLDHQSKLFSSLPLV